MLWRIVIGFAGSFAASLAAAGAPAYRQIYQFTNDNHGRLPGGGLARDAQGRLYGVAGLYQPGKSGTIFRLTPPRPGSSRWTIETLAVFQTGAGPSPNGSPNGELLLAKDGALYGTTSNGYGNQLFGTVYRLAAPASGAGPWQFQLLWVFRGNADGLQPNGGLTEDGAGNIYGTTSIGGGHQGQGFGTAYELSRPEPASPSWTFRTLCYFGISDHDGALPGGGLLLGPGGVLYGATAFGGYLNYGTVYAVTPPAPGSSKWERKTIWKFSYNESTPMGRLVRGNDGWLYGTTYGYQVGLFGSIYRLLPAGPGHLAPMEETIHFFNGHDGADPTSALTPDGKNGFYGVAEGGRDGGGVLFRIVPPAEPLGKWSLITLHSDRCVASRSFGCEPQGPLLRDRNGALYGTNAFDDRYQSGSVFKLIP